uniref:dihydroxyacetone kinase phosphoryl donor subunit DhaM n=1 Tax=Actinomyces sp. TaxID=29317 RepID=UPI00289DB348
MSARVGLVIVSHSDLLARGVVEVASQMAPDVELVAAGGTDDLSLGTSFDRVEAAVGEVLTEVGDGEGTGAVILTDLGSATLTAESVVEFADEPERLVLADAPLVEGAVAAAVRAQLGDTVDEVAAAARG